MHELGNVCIIHNVDGDGLALAHPHERTGNLIVVADRADDNLWGQLNHCGRDSQGEIRRASGGLRFRHRLLRMLWRRRNVPER
jgi:hypothetical protein